MKFTVQSSKIPLPADKVYGSFTEKLFRKLNFPLVPLRIVRFDGCRLNDITHVKIGFPPFAVEWISRNTVFSETPEEIFFIDEGQKLPFFLRRWKHKHRIIRESENVSCIRDEVEFSTGTWITDRIIFPGLWLTFIYRKPVYRRYFTSVASQSRW
jgi:ligand-binding SRPBCC domain-containing protein